VLAARLDALLPFQKALLGDAAVVGRVFWDGALADMGRRERAEVHGALHDLIGKQLVRRLRDSSMAGQGEFAFTHALARDVAYLELPRAVRARKHVAVAQWTESQTGDRAEDFAEIVAHHYATALELARAAGEVALAESLIDATVRYLTLAGDRAWSLDVAAAERDYARALELAGSASSQRPRLLVKWAKAATELGRLVEAVGPLEEAIDRLEAEGDVRTAAVAQMALARVLPDDGDARWLGVADEAVASLEDDGPSCELVAVLTEWLHMTLELGDYGAQLDVAQRAIDLSQQLGSPVDPRLIVLRGCARCDLGLAGGDEDLRRALEMCRTSGPGEDASWVLNYVSNWLYIYEGFHASLAICAEGLDVARRRGAVDLEAELRTVIVWACHAGGDWDRVLDEATAIDSLLETPVVRDPWSLGVVRSLRALVLVERGCAQEGATLLDWLEQRARERPTDGAACSIAAAAARMTRGDPVRALEFLSLGEAALRGKGGYWLAWLLPDGVRIALAAGDRSLAERLAGSLEPLQPIARHALVAAQALVTEARGDFEAASAGFADAASRWHDFAAVYEEAHALLGQGRCLVALGQASEAELVLEQARDIFARLGAKPALTETEQLLGSPARDVDQDL
jgi:tetratricopeptide (TPR) repeat protein